MLREREVDAPQGGVVFLQGSAFTISESLTLVLSETSILSMLSATSLANAANNGLAFPLVVDAIRATNGLPWNSETDFASAWSAEPHK
jgi:hypothetical protein